MNARRRTRPDGLPSRVYKKSGSFYWVHANRWVRLCRVGDGETRMLERLIEEKRKIALDAAEGSMSRLVAIYMEKEATKYADSFRDEWKRRGEDARKAFKAFDIQQVDAGAVADFLEGNWTGKLPTQRAMKSWLSKFFSWAVLRRHVTVNPCREVEVKKPKARKVYIPHSHFLAIREKLAVAYDGKKTPTGPMMQVFVDLCYLTCQRSTDIRLLKWTQVDHTAGVIHFVPTKTEESSGEAVDWPITPEIDEVLRRAKKLEPIGGDYVVRDKRGKPKTDAACRDAWRDAKDRAGLAESPYTVKDIRAKSLTDAKKLGYDIDALQIAGAHSDRTTTEGYIKQREVPTATVHLRLPAA